MIIHNITYEYYIPTHSSKCHKILYTRPLSSRKLVHSSFIDPVQVSTYQTACRLSCVQVTRAKDIVSIQYQAYSGSWDRQPAVSQSQQPILFTEPFNRLNQPAESYSHHGPLCCRNKPKKNTACLYQVKKPFCRSECKKQAHSEREVSGGRQTWKWGMAKERKEMRCEMEGRWWI